MMPIKRNEHIVQLSREHHVTLLFAWKIKQGIAKKIELVRIKKYVEYFKEAHLLPHFAEEENELFILKADDPLQAQALQEHRAINNQLASIQNSTDAELENLLLDLANSIDQHVRFEERVLFPHLEKTLSSSQLEAIGQILNHGAADKSTDDYSDEFWLREK